VTTPPTPKPKPKRRRGAQPGNKNAMTHGFYTRALSINERSDLEAMFSTKFSDVKDFLKVMLMRVMLLNTAAYDEGNTDLFLQTSQRFESLTNALNKTERMEQIIFGNVSEDDPMQKLFAALEVINERNAKK